MDVENNKAIKGEINIMKNKDNKLIYFDEYRKINGIEQYLLHSGTSYDNPVMLFLHCSGFPESLLAYKFQKKWENIFTIVNLDQRGTGKTFTRNLQTHRQESAGSDKR